MCSTEAFPELLSSNVQSVWKMCADVKPQDVISNLPNVDFFTIFARIRKMNIPVDECHQFIGALFWSLRRQRD